MVERFGEEIWAVKAAEDILDRNRRSVSRGARVRFLSARAGYREFLVKNPRFENLIKTAIIWSALHFSVMMTIGQISKLKKQKRKI